MTMPGGAQWLVILIIVLVLFGGAKLPGLARSIGESITEFRKASKSALEDDDEQGADNASERDTDS